MAAIHAAELARSIIASISTNNTISPAKTPRSLVEALESDQSWASACATALAEPAADENPTGEAPITPSQPDENGEPNNGNKHPPVPVSAIPLLTADPVPFWGESQVRAVPTAAVVLCESSAAAEAVVEIFPDAAAIAPPDSVQPLESWHWRTLGVRATEVV